MPLIWKVRELEPGDTTARRKRPVVESVHCRGAKLDLRPPLETLSRSRFGSPAGTAARTLCRTLPLSVISATSESGEPKECRYVCIASLVEPSPASSLIIRPLAVEP